MHEEGTFCQSCGEYLGYLDIGAECLNSQCHVAVCEKPECLEKCFELVENDGKIRCKKCGTISPL